MAIKWDSRLSVGNTVVDLEHKLIISLINALEAVLRHPQEKDALVFFINQLYDFTIEHFAREEKLQLKFLFPHYEENKQGHEKLIDQREWIKKIIIDFAEKTDNSPDEALQVSQKVNQVLRNWFVDHIIKSDMKMKGFMDQAR